MKKSRGNPQLIVYIRKLTVDAEHHSYALRGVCRKVDREEVLRALKNMECDWIVNVTSEAGDIIFGAKDGKKYDPVFTYEYDDADDSETVSAGKLTWKVQATLESALGLRMRVYFKEDTKSAGELIFGDDWNECPGAFTEDERAALNY